MLLSALFLGGICFYAVFITGDLLNILTCCIVILPVVFTEGCIMTLNDKNVNHKDQIIALLDAVASGREEFAILAKSPKRFIQTARNRLEYNSGQRLYCAENISNEDIKAAFLDYFRGNDGYKKFFRQTSVPAEKPFEPSPEKSFFKRLYEFFFSRPTGRGNL